MSAAEVLAQAHAHGVTLWRAGDRLRFRTATGPLPPALRGALQEHRADLLALVGARPPLWWERAPWYGRIAAAEYRAVVEAYIARFGYYTPTLPDRAVDVLDSWRSARPEAS